MQFSDSSTKQGIIEDITFLTGMDTTQYATADRTRNVNRWLLRAIDIILQADADWEFDDTDKTDLPTLTATLVNGQQDYELPKSLTTNAYTLQGDATAGGLLKILRVEVQNANAIWSQLQQLDQREIKQALDEFQKTDGMPLFYDIRGNSLFLYPAPATSYVTLSGGLKIYIAREPDAFTASDTTKEPGFPEPFHRILSLGPSKDWFLKSQQFDRAEAMQKEIDKLEVGLKAFFGGRNKDKIPRITRRGANSRRST